MTCLRIKAYIPHNWQTNADLVSQRACWWWLLEMTIYILQSVSIKHGSLVLFIHLLIIFLLRIWYWFDQTISKRIQSFVCFDIWCLHTKSKITRSIQFHTLIKRSCCWFCDGNLLSCILGRLLVYCELFFHLLDIHFLSGLILRVILTEIIVINCKTEIARVLILIASSSGLRPWRLIHEWHIHWWCHRIIVPCSIREHVSTSSRRLLHVWVVAVVCFWIRSSWWHISSLLIHRECSLVRKVIEFTRSPSNKIVRHITSIHLLWSDLIETWWKLLVSIKLTECSWVSHLHALREMHGTTWRKILSSTTWRHLIWWDHRNAKLFDVTLHLRCIVSKFNESFSIKRLCACTLIRWRTF